MAEHLKKDADTSENVAQSVHSVGTSEISIDRNLEQRAVDGPADDLTVDRSQLVQRIDSALRWHNERLKDHITLLFTMSGGVAAILSFAQKAIGQGHLDVALMLIAGVCSGCITVALEASRVAIRGYVRVLATRTRHVGTSERDEIKVSATAHLLMWSSAIDIGLVISGGWFAYGAITLSGYQGWAMALFAVLGAIFVAIRFVHEVRDVKEWALLTNTSDDASINGK
ncbi:MAG TPA: hypothetical protein VFK05_08360 [Polyangiaceae bacterium]|nr:hypothetical protein [Polyangiaceae bacterium]